MKATRPFSLLPVFIVLVFLLICSLNSFAQDNIINTPNGNGQLYYGDGAWNSGSGGWTYNWGLCLGCHSGIFGDDESPYLMTGHKNSLRKVTPGEPWAGPDGAIYPTTDSYYGSGSTYSWANAQITLGWCDPLSVPLQNGHSPVDPSCQFPYYTLVSSHSPTSYTTVAPTVAAGGVQNMYYIAGGWMNYGGTSNPGNTHLDTIFNGGFTGGQYPDGNYDCARCHATGYNFDGSGPEPTDINLNPLSNAQFSRVPTDGYVAPGTDGTSSWYLTGVQCESCHVSNYHVGFGGMGGGMGVPTRPVNQAATALCLQCHRAETVNKTAHTINPGNGLTGSAYSPLAVSDHGYCSDLSGSAYSNCSSWVYKPFIEHDAGPTFLNSPHARFSGTLTQNAQNSPDLSVVMTGTYNSYFTDAMGAYIYRYGGLPDPTKNGGCTKCHDPHQSTATAANVPNPFVNRCSDCHALSQTILQTVAHPFGQGTPFPTGTTADIPGSCAVCHMQAASGVAGSHLFRISTDPNYSTFPTPDQLYNQNITAPNVASDGVLANAVWLDVDLACGQCHIGGSGNGNPYGLTPPAGSTQARVFTKAQLADIAANGYMGYNGPMHAGDPTPATPTFSPIPGTYNATQSVALSDTTTGAIIYYTLDGSTPTPASTQYTKPIPVSADTTIKAIAVAQGFLSSLVSSGSYTLQATAPTFSPNGGYYNAPQSVTLSDATPGVTIYYTTDGSTPTTTSTPYKGPIALLSTPITIKAIAAGGGFDASSLTQGTYYVTFPVAAAPTFTPPTFWGPFTTPTSVTIADTTPGVTIYYTTNGSTPTTASTPYTGAILVSTTTTIKAVAAGGGYGAGAVNSATYTIIAPTPTFTPPTFWGPFTTPTSVTIADTAPGVTIYYTTNGSTPTTASTPYTGAILVSTTTTIEAVAAGGGYGASAVASGTFTIVAPTPTLAPPAFWGPFAPGQLVTITDTAPGVTIFYTLDGSTPTTASAQYTGPIPVSTTTTIEAMAAGGAYAAGAATSGTYTIVAYPPTFSPTPSGTFTPPTTVTLLDASPGATIYYTTNGSTPTTASTQYTGPFAVSATTTIKAIAAGGGFSSSTVASGTYTE